VVPPAAFVVPHENQLLDGDLIFRRGRDVLATAVLAAQSEGRFSHVGMIVLRDGGPVVIHAMPPEPGTIGGVHAESLERFASPALAADVAIFRMTTLDSATRRQVREYLVSQVGKPFDLAFRYSDDAEHHCTELVLKALERAGQRVAASLPQVSVLGIPERVFPPDAVRLISHLQEVSPTPQLEKPGCADLCVDGQREAGSPPHGARRVHDTSGVPRVRDQPRTKATACSQNADLRIRSPRMKWRHSPLPTSTTECTAEPAAPRRASEPRTAG